MVPCHHICHPLSLYTPFHTLIPVPMKKHFSVQNGNSRARSPMFFVQVPLVWNSLPPCIWHSCSLSQLKTSLKTFLFTSAFSELPWFRRDWTFFFLLSPHRLMFLTCDICTLPLYPPIHSFCLLAFCVVFLRRWFLSLLDFNWICSLLSFNGTCTALWASGWLLTEGFSTLEMYLLLLLMTSRPHTNSLIDRRRENLIWHRVDCQCSEKKIQKTQEIKSLIGRNRTKVASQSRALFLLPASPIQLTQDKLN